MNMPIIYPLADKSNLLESKKLSWNWGEPVGVTIHDSADPNKNRVIYWLEKKNLGYHLMIDKNGAVIQCVEFDKRVNHAGKASWNKLSPNKHHIAICILSWGLLTVSNGKYYSWNKKEIPEKDVSYRPDHLGNFYYYDAATIEQENSLIEILKWMIPYGIEPKNICGHDESCLPVGRKIDPGGVLSKSMESIRQQLAEKSA